MSGTGSPIVSALPAPTLLLARMLRARNFNFNRAPHFARRPDSHARSRAQARAARARQAREARYDGGRSAGWRTRRVGAIIAPMKLNLEFVRRQFPAFAELARRQGILRERWRLLRLRRRWSAASDEYYRRLKVQPYYPFPASTEAGEWMDAARARLAEYLGVTPQRGSVRPVDLAEHLRAGAAFARCSRPATRSSSPTRTTRPTAAAGGASPRTASS